MTDKSVEDHREEPKKEETGDHRRQMSYHEKLRRYDRG